MAYAPINIDAYTNAYSGALAGMAISGWIIDPDAADYSEVAAIAGGFAQAFDIVWNSATALNWLQIQSIQSVCQGQFTGHSPGSLDNASFLLAASWAMPAAACAALVLQGDAFVNSEGITPNTPGGGTRLSRAWWVDSAANPAVANGSSEKPYAHPNAALVAAVAAGLTSITLLIVPGDYSAVATAVDTSGVLRAVTLQGQGQSVGYTINTPQIELGSVTWLGHVNGSLLTINYISVSTGNITVDANGALSGFNILTGNNSFLGFIDNTAKLLGVVLNNSSNGGMIAGGATLNNCTISGTLDCAITSMVDCNPGGLAAPEIGTALSQALCFNFRNSVFTMVNVSGDTVDIDDCTVGLNATNITMGVGATMKFTNTLMASNPSTATLTAGTGFVFDSFTHQQWVTNAGVLTNGQVFVNEFPQFADIVVAVPVVAAAALAYLDVTLVGTALAGLVQDSPIIVNPMADIEAAGATAGGLLQARVSAADTVRLAFKGQLTGGNVTMRFSRVG